MENKENDLIQEAFEIEANEIGFCLDQKWGDYENPYENSDTALAFDLFKKGWKAKQQVLPEGFVLVSRDQITNFWQDVDEPENFVGSESDFYCLGDCIDLGEIIEINKHTQANIKTEKLYGTWFADALFPSKKANFYVGTQKECDEIIAKNKAMLGVCSQQSKKWVSCAEIRDKRKL